MLKYRSGDPYRDFLRWDDDCEEWLSSRPQCYECGDKIQDEYGFRIDGNLYCPNCIDRFKEFID